MELIKKNIHMNKLKCRSNVQVTLDDDFNVPDVKPDIDRIIKEQGEIVIDEVKPMTGKIVVKGSLLFNLLYVCQDDGRPIHNLQSKIPFEEVVNMDGVDMGDNVATKCEIEDLSATLINSRKISVKSIVSFTFCSEEISDEETAVGVTDAADAQCLTKRINVTQIAVNKKDTHRVKDIVTLPSSKANIFEMLYNDVQLRNIETRLMDSKISLKGELQLFVLYSGEDPENPIQFFEAEIPFSGVIECSGCREDMVSDINASILNKSLEVKMDDDGEERVIDIEVVMDLDMKAYEEDEIELMCDIYSTSQDIIPTIKEGHYENLLVKNNSKTRVVDRIQVKSNQPKVLQICNAAADIRIDDYHVVPTGIEAEGVIEVQVLYVSDDDAKPIGATKGVIPFTQVIEVKGMKENSIYDVKPSIESISVIMLDGEEIEVKAGINLNTLVFDRIVEPIITDIRTQPLDLSKLQEMPSMIGYIVKSDDTLWKIAKQFYTTVDNIKEINELQQDVVHQGDKLLLLKRLDAVMG